MNPAHVPWLAAAFVFGACIGSFLNVCIHRLPFQKSLLWPSSRCGHCLKPIRWYDNLPLVSYWWLGGRCRSCGQGFSARYFVVELLTAVCFAVLFWLDVVRNVRAVEPSLLGAVRPDVALLITFAVHAVLLCFLLVATFCDLELQEIPLSLTVTGTVVGLVIAALLPWPWPYAPDRLHRHLIENGVNGPGWPLSPKFPEGSLYAWPVWYPLPSWLAPGGNWQTGLVTGLAGALAGTVALRAVRFLFGIGMGAEYTEPEAEEAAPTAQWFGRRWLSWAQRVGGRALGLGDADLMMMAGAFLGWQAVLLAFFAGVFPGLFFGLARMAVGGTRELPFGPSLAMGTMIVAVWWPEIGPRFQAIFFDPVVVVALSIFCGMLMLVAAYVLRLLRLMSK